MNISIFSYNFPVYNVLYSKIARQFLLRLPKHIKVKIVEGVERIAQDPRGAPNVRPLKGSKNRYRLRVGEYRVVYDIGDSVKILWIIRIGHRREVYRRLHEQRFH